MIAWVLDIVCIECGRDLNRKGNMRVYKVNKVTAATGGRTETTKKTLAHFHYEHLTLHWNI